MGMFDRLFRRRTPAPSVLTVPTPPSPPTVRVAPHFAVLDVETTGLSPNESRVVEIAVVRIDGAGRILDEWSTRLNPEGPVGATHIHGITEADVATAPLFRDIAAHLTSYIAGLPIAAHNAAFDLGFLGAEFQRAGWDVPRLPSFCTLNGSREYLPHLDRRRLADCCWAAGVQLENAHSALGDARATAQLLGFYLNQAGRRQHQTLSALRVEAQALRWPAGPSRAPETWSAPASVRARSGSRRVTAPRPTQPPLLRQLTDVSLLEAVEEGAPDGTLAYLEMLLEALEDGAIDDQEATDLGELIRFYELDDTNLHAAHRALVLAVAHKAVDDGVVSRDERDQLHALCDVLDVPRNAVVELIAHAEGARASRKSAGLRPLPDDWSYGEPLRVGDKVAFTGCDDRQRERLERRASDLGVRVMGNVSRLTAMLVTDGTMDGTKLAKAREVGTRIVHPDTFELLLTHLQPAALPQQPAPAVAPPSHIDVANGHAAATIEDSAPFVVATTGAQATATASPSVVRAWALANGHEVGVRGRISAEVWSAYASASSAAASTGTTVTDPRVEAFEFQGEPMAPLGAWSYAPVVPTQAMALTGGEDIPVVQSAESLIDVQHALGKWRAEDDGELMAMLVAEPENPHLAHAVRVDLLVGRERTTAGYLPGSHAMTFHELVKSAMDMGALPLMRAHVSADGSGVQGVGLHLKHFGDEASRVAVTDEVIALTNERREREFGTR
jgi:DNA polymerase-3 subunit epsilon